MFFVDFDTAIILHDKILNLTFKTAPKLLFSCHLGVFSRQHGELGPNSRSQKKKTAC